MTTSYGVFRLLSVFVLACLMGCGNTKKPLPEAQSSSELTLQHATGFTLRQEGEVTVIEVTSTWPGAKYIRSYALVPKEKLANTSLPQERYDAVMATPVERVVVTSTTHIAALESLGVLQAVVGFPNTDLISSSEARNRIDADYIAELGTNENLNTEKLLELSPELVVGFGVSGTHKVYRTLQHAGIPVVYNGDWTEQTPLGKAEWIKFFAPFFHKTAAADSLFKAVEQRYNAAKHLAQKAVHTPTVLTGGLYKDVWHVAGGNSWMAQFLEDAHAEYLWKDTPETGSRALSLEAVLEKAQQADFWLNPSSHSSYQELQHANVHYAQFAAFAHKRVYSNALKKGPRGGLLFYELAPQRPDLVLQDLITILHPELLPHYTPHFFTPLP